MIMNIPLPKDTTEILKSNVDRISNFGLFFDKYVYSWSKEWNMGTEKKDFMKKLQNTASSNTSKKENTIHYYRQKKICDSFKELGWFGESFGLQTQSRLIIGLGGTNVLETGMTLHPLYGVPYIPASGLKGLARAYAEISETLSPQEIREIFGSEDKDPRHVSNNRQGKVVFMDGWPNSFPKLDLDIMNPHYAEYYQSERDSKNMLIPPGDYLNPVPIFFIAVSMGQIFSFALISRDQECLQKGKECLIGGLTQLGAGGKTNVGYGYFGGATRIDAEDIEREKMATLKKIQSEPIIWKGVTLVWKPGNNVVSTTHERFYAETTVIDKSKIPENISRDLFDKKTKKAVADIVVEHIGGKNYKILKITQT